MLGFVMLLVDEKVRKNSIGMLKGVQAYSTNSFGICLEETHLSLEASWAKWVRDIYLYLSIICAE
jgi:hypothetical protein